jgi:hypothetical protein
MLFIILFLDKYNIKCVNVCVLSPFFLRQQESIKTFKGKYGLHIGSTGPEPLDSYQHGLRLFLIQPRLDDGAPSWMGLGPLGIQAGDFICQFSGMERPLSSDNSPVIALLRLPVMLFTHTESLDALD